jgi:hypothetical protein
MSETETKKNTFTLSDSDVVAFRSLSQLLVQKGVSDGLGFSMLLHKLLEKVDGKARVVDEQDVRVMKALVHRMYGERLVESVSASKMANKLLDSLNVFVKDDQS